MSNGSVSVEGAIVYSQHTMCARPRHWRIQRVPRECIHAGSGGCTGEIKRTKLQKKKKDAGGQAPMSKQPSRRPRLGEHFVFKIRKANILINVSDRALGRISSFCCFLFGSFFLSLLFFLVRFPLVVLIRSRLLDSRPLLLGAFLLLRN